MGNVKTKKKAIRKSSPGYKKPKDATGCQRFSGRTYTEARMLVLKLFEAEYLSALREECQGNVSEMARRADIERCNFRKLLRAAGRIV